MTKQLFEELCEDSLAYLYVIRLSDEEESFYKVGVTSKENTYERISAYPYNVGLILCFSYPSPHLIMDLESKLIRLGPSYKPLKEFGEFSECISSIDEIKSFLEILAWIKDLKEHKYNIVRQRISELEQSLNFSSIVAKYIQSLATIQQDKDLPSFDREIIEESVELVELIKSDSAYETIVKYIELFGVDENLIELSDKARSEKYLEAKILKHKEQEKLKEFLKYRYEIGTRKSSAEFKKEIGEIYKEHGISGTAKATDLNLVFKTKRTSTSIEGVITSCLKIEKYL